MSAARPRETLVDALRGFALLGIVVVNVPFLALSAEGFTAASIASTLDRAAAFATIAFAQAKFYVLFAFVFGYSATFLLSRNDVPQRRRYFRRLLGLAAFGVLHVAFAFVGDILVLYALLGIALPWLMRWRDGRLLWFAGVLLAAWWGLLCAVGLWALDARVGAGSSVDVAGPTPAFIALNEALRSGGFADAVIARLHAWPDAFSFIALMNGPAVAAMFALGLVAGRRRWLAEGVVAPVTWRRLAVWGWCVGLPPSLWSAWASVGQGFAPASDALGVLGTAVGFAAAPLLTLAYVATFALAHAWRPRLTGLFPQSGRMSLTGYLGESLVLSLIFSAYGGALFGGVGAAAAMAVGLGTWVALDVCSRLWLARFEQGPLERALGRISGR